MGIDPVLLSTLTAAFVAGLVGSLHCVGMCGGIASALGMSQKRAETSIPPAHFAILYQIGRISSYAVAGMIAGSLGEVITQSEWLKDISLYLRLFFALFIIGLGLFIAGWFPAFSIIERMGLPLWKKISPLSKKLIPVTKYPQAYALGFLWGWLPCGLTYSILLWSVSSASSLNGGLIMLTFGLGTIPAMFSVTLGAGKISKLVRYPWVRKIAGMVLIIAGVFVVLGTVKMASHDPATHEQMNADAVLRKD